MNIIQYFNTNEGMLNYNSHDWIFNYEYKSYKCKNCSTYIRYQPGEFGIFVFKYPKEKAIVEYGAISSFSFQLIIEHLINKISTLTCNEIIIKQLLE